jgi:hypothetical protein
MMIIGLTGTIQTGKTTMAEYVSLSVANTKIMSFGDHLKETAKYLFFLEDDDVYTLEGKEKVNELTGKRVRELLQITGTEFVRDLIHPDFWVKALDKKIENLPNDVSLVMIDDCRFENECNYIRSKGGVIIHLTRKRIPKHKEYRTESKHRSEQTFWYVPGDYVIELPQDENTAKDLMTALVETIIHNISFKD